MRRTCILALALAGCAEATTLELHAPSLAGARASVEGSSTTLDGAGHGTIVLVPPLYDAWISVELARGDVVERLGATCIPPLALESQPIERAELLVRRATESGECVLIALEIQQDGRVRRGRYMPEHFDDAPCGPFAE